MYHGGVPRLGVEETLRIYPPAARDAAEKAAAGALTGTDSNSAMERSLYGDDPAPQQASRPMGVTSIMRIMSPGSRRSDTGTQPRVLLAPAILTNAVGIDTVEARAVAFRELQAAGSPKRTRHIEISLPSGVTYQVGDHLGVCPKNDEEQVERLARHLGAVPDGLFRAPRTMYVHAVPKGVVLQVRNVLTNLVEIAGRPMVPLLDLLLEKADDPAERSRLAEIREILQTPDGPASALRAAVDADGYDVLRLLDEFRSCSPNIFEFLRVAQPMRAFLWERLAMKRAGVPLGEAALFDGIRSRQLDYIYRDEIEHLAAARVLDHVQIAASREQPGRRDYVQDRIREQGALVWRLITAGGYVYVCGSQPMRDAVREAFVDVSTQQGRLPRERAEAYLHELEATAHYRPDLWG